jgi:hypothetical protein
MYLEFVLRLQRNINGNRVHCNYSKQYATKTYQNSLIIVIVM